MPELREFNHIIIIMWYFYVRVKTSPIRLSCREYGLKYPQTSKVSTLNDRRYGTWVYYCRFVSYHIMMIMWYKKIRLSVLLHINLTRRDKNYNILIPFIFVKA